MDKRINLSEITSQNSEIVIAREDIIVAKFSSLKNSKIIMPFRNDIRNGAQFLTFDAYCHNDENCCCLEFEFFVRGNDTQIPDFFFILGILPKIKTTISLPLQALDGSKIFLERIPGAMKFLTHGKNVNPEDVERFAIKVRKSAFTQRIQFSNMRFTETAVQKHPTENILVDEFGQWKGRKWEDKITSEAELMDHLNKCYENSNCDGFGEDRSIYGGWTKLRFDNGTSFFRTKYDGKRWWLVDPQGYAFFSAGLDCVRSDESFTNTEAIKTLIPKLPPKEGIFADAYNNKNEYDFAIANLIRAFGTKWYDKWFKITKSRLNNWGFNTVANWSDFRFCRKAQIPYVFNMKGFPKTEKYIFRDFPDVFSDEYEKNSRLYAKQLEELRNDSYLIGYFLANEPVWAWGENVIIAEDLLRSKEQTCTKTAFIEFLYKRYGAISSLNKAWNMHFDDFSQLNDSIMIPKNQTDDMKTDLKEFSSIMVKRYCEIPSKCCKEVDPNHLNLGLRFASIPNREILEGSNVFDVFSLNCYKIDPLLEIEGVGHLNMPVMIGEYHFGALDRGLPSTGLRAVTTQKERGNAYRYYLGRAASVPTCVGVHYFTLNDQPALGRYDGENYQIGFVNVCGKEYKEIVAAATETHKNMYDIAAGNIERFDIYPDETDWVAF